MNVPLNVSAVQIVLSAFSPTDTATSGTVTFDNALTTSAYTASDAAPPSDREPGPHDGGPGSLCASLQWTCKPLTTVLDGTGVHRSALGAVPTASRDSRLCLALAGRHA
ncbi:MAG: hypothetical protein M3N29_06505 [Chloroflexota bacterium]|nr:hypothetical protein [Chloroflexota bacterium]